MKLKLLPKRTTFKGTLVSSQFSFSQSLKDQQSSLLKKKLKLRSLKGSKSLSVIPKMFSAFSEFNSHYLKSKRYSIYLKETQQDLRKTVPIFSQLVPSDPLRSVSPTSSQSSLSRNSVNMGLSDLKSLKSQDYSRSAQSLFATSKKFKSSELIQDPESEYKSKLESFTVFKSNEEEDFKTYYFEKFSQLSTTTRLKLEEELKSMKKDLPCCLSGSIFLMFKASNIGKMRVLISGKPDTAFADGLYLFDITIPDRYPEVPPSVVFRTSTNTNFMFHPDLLQNGTIISSLLNTQLSGPNGWSNKCTLAQVLLHIQSKIMNNSFANSLKIPDKNANNANLSYRFEVRVGNIEHAIIPLILFPLAGFQEVIFRHFSLKYKEILERIQSWINDAVYYQASPNIFSQNPKTRTLLDSGAIKIFQKLHLRLCQVVDSTFLRGHI